MMNDTTTRSGKEKNDPIGQKLSIGTKICGVGNVTQLASLLDIILLRITVQVFPRAPKCTTYVFPPTFQSDNETR
jgi:hypothetical protein